MSDDYDYSESPEPVAESEMQKLMRLVGRMSELELRRLQMETEQTQVAQELKEFSEGAIPTIMDELNLKTLKTRSGMEVDLVKLVIASLPEDETKRDEAFQYVIDSGNAALIKRQFVITFPRDRFREAEEFAKLLESCDVRRDASIKDEKTIHHGQLVAFLKRELAAGKSVPMKAFGAFEKSFAKIKGT